MDKRITIRKALIQENQVGQLGIAGLSSALPERGVDAAFLGLLGACEPVEESTHPLVIAARQNPSDQNKFTARSKAKPEIMRASLAYDTGVQMQRIAWGSREEGIDKSDTLEAIAAREEHAAKGMYNVSDRYAELGGRAATSPLNDGPMLAVALNQRADVFNGAGVKHEVRSLIARDGLEGVMARGNITEDQAFAKVKKAQGVDLMNRHFLEASQKQGAEIEGLASPEEIGEVMRAGGPEAGRQMNQLRDGLIRTAYPRDYKGEDRRDHMIKRAALLAHAKDLREGPYDGAAAQKLDKEIVGLGISRHHPLMKTFGKARAGMQERVETRALNEDVR